MADPSPSVVVITGCSSGFGRAAALALAEHPSIVVDRLDVTDPASRALALARTLDRFGRIDVLANNARVAVH